MLKDLPADLPANLQVGNNIYNINNIFSSGGKSFGRRTEILSRNQCEPCRKGGGAATFDCVVPTTGTGIASGRGLHRCSTSGERAADSAFHRSGEVPAHETQRTAGLAQELAENRSWQGADEEGCRSREATTFTPKATSIGRSETEQPTAIAP